MKVTDLVCCNSEASLNDCFYLLQYLLDRFSLDINNLLVDESIEVCWEEGMGKILFDWVIPRYYHEENIDRIAAAECEYCDNDGCEKCEEYFKYNVYSLEELNERRGIYSVVDLQEKGYQNTEEDNLHCVHSCSSIPFSLDWLKAFKEDVVFRHPEFILLEL